MEELNANSAATISVSLMIQNVTDTRDEEREKDSEKEGDEEEPNCTPDEERKKATEKEGDEEEQNIKSNEENSMIVFEECGNSLETPEERTCRQVKEAKKWAG